MNIISKKKFSNDGYDCFEDYPFLYPNQRAENCRSDCKKKGFCKCYSENNYFINQRVILNKEIGKVVKPENDYGNGIWVFLESRGFASCYDPNNIKPLPNEEL